MISILFIDWFTVSQSLILATQDVAKIDLEFLISLKPKLRVEILVMCLTVWVMVLKMEPGVWHIFANSQATELCLQFHDIHVKNKQTKTLPASVCVVKKAIFSDYWTLSTDVCLTLAASNRPQPSFLGRWALNSADAHPWDRCLFGSRTVKQSHESSHHLNSLFLKWLPWRDPRQFLSVDLVIRGTNSVIKLNHYRQTEKMQMLSLASFC